MSTERFIENFTEHNSTHSRMPSVCLGLRTFLLHSVYVCTYLGAYVARDNNANDHAHWSSSASLVGPKDTRCPVRFIWKIPNPKISPPFSAPEPQVVLDAKGGGGAEKGDGLSGAFGRGGLDFLLRST